MSDERSPPKLPPTWLVPPLLAVRDAIGRLHRGTVPPILRVLETTLGFVEAKALFVAAELGIADALATQPRDPTELAAAVAADADALARLLRLLEALGYFTEGRDGRWRNTPASELLRADRSDSVREWVRFLCGPWHGEIWNHAAHAFRTGDSATVEAFGAPFFDWLTVHPGEQQNFDAAMEQVSQLVGPSLAVAYDFSIASRVCDVGGGTGTTLATLLSANGHLRGVLFDLPDVVARSGPVLDRYGVRDRVEPVGGSFFESVPAGCDRYLLQAVVHDWSDAECLAILGNVRAAMAPEARVLVVDQLMPDRGGARATKATDLMMLVLTGSGRERTRAEFSSLFTRAGFRVSKVMALAVVGVQELVAI